MEILHEPLAVKLKKYGKGQLLVIKSSCMPCCFLAKTINIISSDYPKTRRILNIHINSKIRGKSHIAISGVSFIQDRDEMRFYFNMYQKDQKLAGYINVLTEELNTADYYLLEFDNQWKTVSYRDNDFKRKRELLNEIIPQTLQPGKDRGSLFRELNLLADKITSHLICTTWN